jgi:hypothetical protein
VTGLAMAFAVASLLPGVASIIGAFRSSPCGWLLTAACSGLMAVSWAIAGVRAGVAVHGLLALFALWMWWRNRRGKGRLRAALSGKYGHVRDAMARTLRDRRVTRPALAPGRA